jgi:lysophospholipase L1-like esterase
VINSGVGLGRKSWTGTAAGNKRVLTFTGTGVDIFYAKFNAGGTGYYKIDGGASTTFSTLNSSGGFGTYNTLDGQRIQVRGLTAGSHTVEVGWSSGGTVFVNGFMIYNGDESKGIRVWNGSKSSQQSSYFVDTANPAWTDNVATVQPSLIIFGTLCNDWYYGMPSATSKTNLQTLIANIKAKCTTTPSFIFNLEFQRDITSGSTVEPWANYVKVAYDIAAADPNNVAVFDMGKRAFGPGPFTAGTALVDPDKIHPNDAGMQAWADALAGFLLPR